MLIQGFGVAKLSGKFYPSIGLIRGDPISPFLVLLVVDFLGESFIRGLKKCS